MNPTRFPRTARVRARSDFDRIFKHGRRSALPVLALHFQADPGIAPRLGLAVSRKVDPNAVGRNRIKRVLRDAFRHVRAELAPGDYVLVARPGASACSGEELRAAFHSLLKRAGARPAPALPPTPAPGTMPAASLPESAPDSGPG